MSKEFWKCALIRAIRTVAQNLASTLPVGIVITVEMLKHTSIWDILYIILAWLLTGLLGGIASILTSIRTGLPEVELIKNDTVKVNEEIKDNE